MKGIALDSDLPPAIESSVLCVDFDGTFTPVDSLHECVVAALRAQPWIIFALVIWLLRGREHLKRRLIDLAGAHLRPDLFPRRPEIMTLIAAARAQGRHIELVSAAHHDLVVDACPDVVFDAVFGSRNGVNLKGAAKAKFLADRHESGFAYVGNSQADIPVWQAARERFAVDLSASTRRRIRAAGLTVTEISVRRPSPLPLLRAMRPHQWVKNLLIFVSLGLNLQSLTAIVVLKFIAVFVAFCAMTSGTYILNDMADVVADRLHPRKCLRPLASGTLSAAVAIPTAIFLIAVGLAVAFAASANMGMILLAYIGLTLAYSLGLKQLAIVDVMVLATLFTVRIVAGTLAYEAPVSQWIIIFSLFFFASLAFMKRAVEVASSELDPSATVAGRGYQRRDEPFLLAVGASFGVAALVIFSLYVSEVSRNASQYRGPEILWIGLAFLGYWTMHMWLRASRRQMHDDPILFAIRDRVSRRLGAAVLLAAVLAQLLEF